MASLLRQETQIHPSVTFDDTVAAGATMESGSANMEDDLNAIRSQLQRYFGETNWYDDISGRTVALLGTDLTDLEGKRFLFRTQVLTDISVTAAQNWEVLSVAGSEAPTETAAVGAVTTNGAVVAAHGGTFGTTHSLAEVAGANAIQPKNLVVVRDADTGEAILSGGKVIWGLLQSESAVDGHTFDDATNQVQISFIIENATADDLIACPVVDIAGKDVNYSYVRRINLDAIPEQAFLAGVFVDQSAAVDVTLNNAIDNQVGAATQDQNIDVRITDTFSWAFQDSTGAVDILRVDALAAGDEVELNVANFDVNNTNDADFSGGALFDTGGTQIGIGSTAGQIDSAAALTIITGATGDLTLNADNGEMILADVNKDTSTYAGAFKLAETATEWDNFETEFGEVSLLNALVQANQADTTRVRVFATVQNGPHAPGTNITGAGATPELDTQLTDYSAMTFITDVDIYHNGQLQVNAAGATEDVYPGDTPANGDFKSTKRMFSGDKIIMITWG
jgi:hypothetical protein